MQVAPMPTPILASFIIWNMIARPCPSSPIRQPIAPSFSPKFNNRCGGWLCCGQFFFFVVVALLYKAGRTGRFFFFAYLPGMTCLPQFFIVELLFASYILVRTHHYAVFLFLTKMWSKRWRKQKPPLTLLAPLEAFWIFWGALF